MAVTADLTSRWSRHRTLDPHAVASVQHAIAEIARSLLTVVPGAEPTAGPTPDGGVEQASGILGFDLSRGYAGIALFFAYAARLNLPDSDRYALASGAALQAAYDGLEAAGAEAGLHHGAAGVLWTHAHLAVYEGVDAAELDRQLREPEEALLEVLAADGTPHYDLISGAVGVGVYALERRESAFRMEALTRVVRRLERDAEPCGPGLAWRTAPALLPPRLREPFPNGRFDLGIAHGCAGVVALLARVVQEGLSIAGARELLEASAWCLADAATGGGLPERADGNASLIPSCLRPDPRPGEDTWYPARLAWCYGDGGCALALLQAASALQSPSLVHRATEIADHAVGVTDAVAGVVDASLCHGAAGLSHLFRRLHHLAGHKRYLDRADFWLQRTLSFRTPGAVFGGFRYLEVNGHATRWTDLPGLLEGAAGIGLALVAALDTAAPAWDRALLLSGSP